MKRVVGYIVSLMAGLFCAWVCYAAPPTFKPLQSFDVNDPSKPSPSNFSVSPLGEAVWSMPIWIPSGRNGIEPHLAISYRSGAPNGLLGLRFTVDGLSSISRCWGTPAQDGRYTAGPTPGLPDKYCLNGQRLFQVPGGSPSTITLRPEFEPSVSIKITGTLEDPEAFSVYFADGQIERFGYRDSSASGSSKSRVRANPVVVPIRTDHSNQPPEYKAGFEHTLRWNVDRVEDRYGNYFEVDYERTIDPGVGGSIEVVPAEIRWTGFSPAPGVSSNPIPPSRRIKFNYLSLPKIDMRVVYRAGVPVKNSKLLWSIQVFAQDGLVSDPSAATSDGSHVKTEMMFRRYVFSYQPDSTFTSFVDRLSTIQECVSNTATSEVCLTPISFGWSTAPRIPNFHKGDIAASVGDDFPLLFSGNDPSTTPDDPSYKPVGIGYDIYDAVVGDFDGDGRSDFLYRLPKHNSDGTIFNVGDANNPAAVGEWFIRFGTPTGLGPRIAVPGLPPSKGGDWVFTPKVVDIDGDGKDELLLFRDKSESDYQIYRYSCRDTKSPCDLRTCSETKTLCDFVALGAWYSGTYLSGFKNRLARNFPMLIADMNGDGTIDLVKEDAFVVQNGPTPTQLSINEGAHAPSSTFPIGSFATDRQLNITTGPGVGAGVQTHMGDDRFVVDIDGHGQHEVLTPIYNSGSAPVTLSALQIAPSQTPDTLAQTKVIPTSLEYWDDPCIHTTRFFVDFNGDGIADALTFNSTNYVNLSCWLGLESPFPSSASSSVTIALNSGSGFRLPVTMPLLFSIYSPIGQHNLKVNGGDSTFDYRYYDQGIRIVDLDNDGKTDVLLVPGWGVVAKQITWLKSSGFGFQVISLDIPAPSFSGIYEYKYPPTGTVSDFLARNSDRGGYGPRLIQVGDFNGDGLVDVVQPDGANLGVYLQSTHLPDLVTSITGGPLMPARTIEYEYAGSKSSKSYTKAQCDWPQTCMKSLGWIVTSSSAESLYFDSSPPTRTVTDYKYKDARSDNLGRGWLGVSEFTQTTRDGASNRVFATNTSAFDLTHTVCHDASNHICAYTGLNAPSLSTVDIAISDTPNSASRLTRPKFYHKEVAAQPTMDPLVPGSFGYHLSTLVNTTVEQERILPLTRAATQITPLTATRTTQTFDKFENVISTKTETSLDPLPLNGSVRSGQIVYQTLQKTNLPQTPDIDSWLVSRYPQYQFTSIDPTLAAGEQEVTQTVDVTYEPSSVEIKSTTLEQSPVAPESDTVSGFTLAITYNRDDQGNVVSLTRTGSGSERTVTVSFDANDADRIFFETLTDPLGHQSVSYRHAALGVVVARDDPNGIRTEYEYDALGRLKSRRPAGGTQSTYTYSTSPSLTSTLHGARKWSACETNDGTGTQCATFDPAGRMVESAVDGFDHVVRKQFTYDQFGRMLSRSVPFTPSSNHRTPPAYIQYERDGLGRVVSVSRPGPTAASAPYYSKVAYNGLRITSTDERGVVSTKDIDEKGRVIRQARKEPPTSREVVTSYGYWHFNLPQTIVHPVLPASQAMAINPAALVTTIKYDKFGRQQEISDPDSGTTITRYNAFGEIKSSVDANNGITTFHYDNLGRLGGIETPGTLAYPPMHLTSWAQRTRFVYDTAPNGVGRIAQIHSNDGITINFGFDQFGRLKTNSWMIPGFPDAFVFSYDYNALGQLEYLNYPSNGGAGPFKLNYTYAGNGDVRQIFNASDPLKSSLLWAQIGRDAAGNSTEEQFGLVDHVLRHFDFANQVQSISGTFISNGQAFQRLQYDWDAGNLLRSRNDLDPNNQTVEQFKHDFLNRLSDWTTSQGGRTTKWRYHYDDLGNLRLRETVPIRVRRNRPPALMYPATNFEYTTPTVTSQPHAPKRVTTKSLTETLIYDSAGQLVSGRGNSYVWTPFGLPRSISGPSGITASFLYDGTRTRTVGQLARAGKTASKINLYGLLLLRTDQLGVVRRTYNVMGPKGPVAQVIRTPNASNEVTRFIHADHLGSPDAVTSQSFNAAGGAVGGLIERQKYEPFGERRAPTAVARPAQSPAQDADVGFAGHEPDNEFGLINMRARLYDATIAHFVSPDHAIPSGVSEGLNLYSYVRNSPLSLTDPTGLQPQQFSYDWIYQQELNPGTYNFEEGETITVDTSVESSLRSGSEMNDQLKAQLTQWNRMIPELSKTSAGVPTPDAGLPDADQMERENRAETIKKIDDFGIEYYFHDIDAGWQDYYRASSAVQKAAREIPDFQSTILAKVKNNDLISLHLREWLLLAQSANAVTPYPANRKSGGHAFAIVLRPGERVSSTYVLAPWRQYSSIKQGVPATLETTVIHEFGHVRGYLRTLLPDGGIGPADAGPVNSDAVWLMREAYRIYNTQLAPEQQEALDGGVHP
jgi:RHS repeat-associated protein